MHKKALKNNDGCLIKVLTYSLAVLITVSSIIAIVLANPFSLRRGREGGWVVYKKHWMVSNALEFLTSLWNAITIQVQAWDTRTAGSTLKLKIGVTEPRACYLQQAVMLLTGTSEQSLSIGWRLL